MLPLRTTLLSLAIATAIPALAHEGGKHVRGVVKAISKDQITVATADGRAAAFALAANTRIHRGGAAIGFEAVRVGERAVVHGKPGAGGFVATEVKLGGGVRK